MSRLWRLGLLLLAAVAAAVVAAPAASAHPLGNFTINHLGVVSVSRDGVEVRYLLDQAEIPTFQERGAAAGDLLAAKRAEVARGLELTIDGRPTTLRPSGPGRISFPDGQGGLRTTRVELLLTARARGARRIELRDRTFADRVGWRDIVVRPGEGTAVRSSVPATEPTDGLRRYPKAVLDAPSDRRAASFEVRPGDATVDAPGADPGGSSAAGRGAGGFAGVLDGAAAGDGVLIAFLFAAFGWGALHALSPGHGKSMVAAYLVGTRGSVRDAVALGATVTVTHTIGVFALGLVTLALSDYLLPEDLYPWLNLVAGALVLLVGLQVLRLRLRGVADGHDHHHGAHDHHHGHHHHGAHDHQHHEHDHHHGEHDRADPSTAPVSRRSLLALGASAGLIPCPSALVVLLGAVAQQEIALGLLLIVSFSLGLAATLTGLGVAVVWSAGRVARRRPRPAVQRFLTHAPTVSALVIVVLGCVLTLRALPALT